MNNFHSVHLITFYSDHRFRRAAKKLKTQAQNSHLFSSVQVWNPKLVQEVAHNSYRNLMKLRSSLEDNDKGYGLWYWKPVIIEESLKRLGHGSILVYLDAGCYLNFENPYAVARFNQYLNYTIQFGSLAMQLVDGEFGIEDLSENSWTSNLVLTDFQIPFDLRISNQIQAGIQFMTVNSENLSFASEWRLKCEANNFAYLKGDYEFPNNKSGQHRYDQSIFSCLYKLRNRFYIPDETFFSPNWKIQGERFPIWAMRNRDGIDPFQMKVADFFPRIARRLSMLDSRMKL